MTGYCKKIAVVKQLKSGFSADGGALSGLVKAETYAGFLKVEASLINFAPLTEGRYVLGVSDGLNAVVFEGQTFEGEAEFNLSSGFAFLVCFCHGDCSPVASASCGQMACALPDLKEEMARRERAKPAEGGAAYQDEAIAEVNYYEYPPDEDGGAVRAAAAEEEKGNAGGENAAAAGVVPTVRNGLNGTYPPPNGENPRQNGEAVRGENPRQNGQAVRGEGDCANDGQSSANGRERAQLPCGGERLCDGRRATDPTDGRNPCGECGEGGERARGEADGQSSENGGAENDRAERIRLADGNFYDRMRGEIEKIFAAYPKEAALEQAMEGSRWAKIDYADDRYYVFGVLSVGGKPRYLCYGVPSTDSSRPPRSLEGCASFMPTANGGYWILYQDADTGVSVRLGVS